MSDPKKQIEILVVDDDQPTADFVSALLTKNGFRTTIANSAADAVSLLRKRTFPIVVSDLYLGGPDGRTLIPHVKAQRPEGVLILMTGQAGIESAVGALREGAFEYLSKENDLHEMEGELLGSVQRGLLHLAYQKDALEKDSKQNSNSVSEDDAPKAMVGTSPRMAKLYRLIAKAAVSQGNVLISGESGTGKELIAHAIHKYGEMESKPFVMVNCGTLTETLLESELFGHVKGAFTGAIGNKKGLFEQAHGGILFLDEIGDTSPLMQVKLLRAIQEGEIRPVGSNETKRVQVRIIAATHRDLEAYIRQNLFREDLYFRLRVFHIQAPPLRERTEDIPELVKYFITRASRSTGSTPKLVSEGAMDELKNYSWPGNVRELENAIERAIGMTAGDVLMPGDFELASRQVESENSSETSAPTVVGLDATPKTEDVPTRSLEQVECQHIAEVLKLVYYNKSKAAKILGIDRGTLYNKAQQCKIPLRGEL